MGASPEADRAKAELESWRGRFFFAACALVVASFAVHCVPLALLSRRAGALGLLAYRTGFLAAAAAHGYRLAYTLRPQLAAAGGTAAGLQAAAPGLARDMLRSNAFLVRRGGQAPARVRARARRRATSVARRRRPSPVARLTSPVTRCPRRRRTPRRPSPVARRIRLTPVARAQYTLYCLLFFVTRPTPLALAPVAFHALLQALTYLVKNPPAAGTRGAALWAAYGPRAYALLEGNLPTALGMCATAQVMLGVTLLLSLLTRQREVAKTFLYWNVLLRGFWHCPDAVVFRCKLPASSAQCHQQAWRAMDAKLAPVWTRVPPLARAKAAASNWFCASG
jgi:hypothetical protein